MENIYVNRTDKKELFYRVLESEPTFVAVFDALTGLHVANYDKEVFEQKLKQKFELTGDVMLTENEVQEPK